MQALTSYRRKLLSELRSVGNYFITMILTILRYIGISNEASRGYSHVVLAPDLLDIQKNIPDAGMWIVDMKGPTAPNPFHPPSQRQNRKEKNRNLMITKIDQQLDLLFSGENEGVNHHSFCNKML